MSRTAWIIVIVLIVIVLLFVVYRFMFANKPEISTTVNNDGSFSIPVINPVKPNLPKPSGAIDTTEVNPNITIPNVQSSLKTVLQTLGYYVTEDEQGNVSAIGSPSESKSSLIKMFSIRFKGINNIFGNLVDGNKWKSYVAQGLENISYNNKDDIKASEIYNKIVVFWGSSFFNVAAQKIIETSRNANKPNVDCNSKEYLDKLTKLTYLLKQAQREYQIAVINISKIDNSENRQALDRTGKAVDFATGEYTKWADLCKK